MSRKIITLAHLTVKKYLFTPGFILLIVVLLLIPFWSSFLRGDGTMEGKFKVFITYSFLLTSLILTIVNISFSCIAVSGEWKKKTLLLLDVKPVRRWEIILGKWVGLFTLNLVLIIAFLLSVTFSSLFLSQRLKKTFPRNDKNIFLTYTQVFPASFQEKAETKKPPLLNPPEATTSFPSSKGKETYAVPPRGKVVWNFKGIKNGSSDIYLVFRFYTSKKKKGVLGYWLVSNPSLETPMELSTGFSPDKVHRLRIPSQAISKKGEISLTYLNIEPSNVSVLFPRRELRILYPWGSYWDNLFRGGINLLFIVGFISAIGMFFSTLVSTLTAVLSTSVLVFIAYLHDFVEMIVKSLAGGGGAEKAVGLIPRLSYPLLKFLIYLLPPLNKFLPHSYIGNSLILNFFYLKDVFLRTILLGAIPVLIITMLYFSRRELGIPNE